MVESAFILSDIHLGASNSVLTAFDYEPQTGTSIERPFAKQVLDKLLDDITEMRLGQKIDQCILLGDIFDLSFAPYGLAMQNGRWFFEQLIKADLFKSFVYIPGNHDHHLWQQICEHYYLMTALDNPPLDYPRTLPANFLLNNTFLDSLLPEGHSFQVTYPNYAFTIADKPFYLHHGHYLQQLYLAASKFLGEVMDTSSIDDLETLNAPFLEFGWYNMGQAYNMGQRKLIDRMYFLFKNNRTKQIDSLIRLGLKKLNRLGKDPTEKGWHPVERLLDYLNQRLGAFFVHRMFFKQSRRHQKMPHASTARHKRLTESAQQAIADYLRQYLLPQTCEVSECTFIFGHTHEPEHNVVMDIPGKTRVHLYNTGGWIVDQVDAEGNWVLPQAAPLFICEDGSIQTLPFTHKHHAFLQNHLATDPSFQAIKQQQVSFVNNRFPLPNCISAVIL